MCILRQNKINNHVGNFAYANGTSMARAKTPSSLSSHAIADKEQTLIRQIAEHQQPRRLARSLASRGPSSSRFRSMRKPGVQTVVTPTGLYSFFYFSVRFFATCVAWCLSLRRSLLFHLSSRRSLLFATSTSVSSDRAPFLGSLQLFERSSRRSERVPDEIR